MTKKEKLLLAVVAIILGGLSSFAITWMLSAIPSGVAPHSIAGYRWNDFAVLWVLWAIFWLIFLRRSCS